MAGELRKYTEFVRSSPCRLCGAAPRSQQHHKCEGPTVPPGDRERFDKRIGGKRGKSQTAHDYFSISLCVKCHAAVQELRGICRTWTKEYRATWEDEEIAEQHREYDAWLADRQEQDELPVAPGRPVPSSVDDFDIERAADAFVAEYPTLGAQGRHDLVRLLKRAVTR